MTDEKLAPVLRSWLRHRDVPAPDSAQTAAHVLARLPRVRQRGRWWLLPALGRGGSPPVSRVEPRSHALGRPIHHYPTVTGRTRLMFSPVKAIIAGALVFALGGLYYIAQPLDQQPGAVPGSEMTELPGVTVTVAQDCVEEGDTSTCSWTASDPRLTGTATARFTGDVSDDRPGDGLRTGLSWLDIALAGPEGSWSGHEYLMWTDPFQHVIVLSGSGAYAGWHYVAMATTEAPPRIDWTGVMYEGELPPFGPLAVSSTE